MKAKTLRSSKFRNSSPESKVWFRDTSSSSCWLFGDTYEHIHVVHVANSRISCIIPDVRLFWFRHIICSNQLWLWSWYGSSGSVAPLWFVDTPPRKLEVSSSRESESLCGERCAPRWGGRLPAALPSYPVYSSHLKKTRWISEMKSVWRVSRITRKQCWNYMIQDSAHSKEMRTGRDSYLLPDLHFGWSKSARILEMLAVSLHKRSEVLRWVRWARTASTVCVQWPQRCPVENASFQFSEVL